MQLHRGDVVAGALAVLDTDGLDGLTMRKLAAQLGVKAAALYWHFENKQALLDAMAERLVEGVGAPLPAGSWDEQLSVLAGRLRQALLSHRDGARVMAGTYVAEPNTLLVGNRAIAVLEAAGLSPERAGWLTFALAHYVLGHTIEEQAQAELTASGAWAANVATADQRQDPSTAPALAATIAADPADRFAYGLRVFLDGIGHQLPPPSAKKPGGRRAATRTAKRAEPAAAGNHLKP